MGDYHDDYLKKVVLLLADVFKKFIDTCFKFYKLDTCHYFTSPGLSWDAMLKMTGVEFQTNISDIGMYLFIEKELRGGIIKLLKDIVKQITNTCKIMTRQNRQNSYHTWIWIIYTAGTWVTIFLMVDLSG